jgi:CheY-like chemotaxis protein
MVKTDVCLSGMDAVALVGANYYDLVFMDHMMPEMDGIEATALIRAMQGEYFQKVPIIALTANAVSGMREMFLQNGFNDFLSKPIELAKLNEIMKHWVPPEKRMARQAMDLSAPAESGLVIEGLNTSRGLASTGGTAEGYIKVLETYCRDAEQRLEILTRVPDENDLPLFITQVHALKSASASIGAEETARLAMQLEEAGKKRDFDFIKAELGLFAENLSALLERIRQALAPCAFIPEPAKEADAGEFARYQEIVPRLKQALLAEQVGETDSLLEELSAMDLNPKIRETLAAAAALVLTAEFQAAARLTDGLIKEESGE